MSIPPLRSQCMACLWPTHHTSIKHGPWRCLFRRPPKPAPATPDEHECVFVEEQEPRGRLILPPCISCGAPAMDVLQQMYREAGRA